MKGVKGTEWFHRTECLQSNQTVPGSDPIPSTQLKFPRPHVESWPTMIRIDKMNHIDVVETLTDAQQALTGGNYVNMSYIVYVYQ